MFDLSIEIDATPMTEEEDFYARIDQYFGNLGEIIEDKDFDPEYFITPWAQFHV